MNALKYLSPLPLAAPEFAVLSLLNSSTLLLFFIIFFIRQIVLAPVEPFFHIHITVEWTVCLFRLYRHPLFSLSFFPFPFSLSLSLTSIYIRNGAFLCLLMASSSLQLGSLLLACWQSFKVNTHTHKLSGSAPSRPNLSIIHVSVLFSLPTFSLPRSSSSSFPIDVLNFPLCLLVYLWYSTFFLLFFFTYNSTTYYTLLSTSCIILKQSRCAWLQSIV